MSYSLLGHELRGLHANRLAKKNFAFYDENSLTISFFYMHMDWSVVFTVKEESVSVFGKNYCISPKYHQFNILKDVKAEYASFNLMR
jgi:hypothetical protein